MVSQLPYFMIQWDYRGEKGFGHVIEGDDKHPGSSKADPGVDGDHTSIVDDGLKGTKFPRYIFLSFSQHATDIVFHSISLS
jgi:hypothetical protein